MAQKNALDTLIRTIATTKIGGKYNLAQYKEEKERLLHRKEICESLVNLSTEHNIPLSFLVYFAVDKQSHRPCNFEQNYVKFNADKAIAIIAMAKEFALHHGYKKPNDKVYHACTAYYERHNTDFDIFKSIVDAMTPNKKWCTAKSILIGLGVEK